MSRVYLIAADKPLPLCDRQTERTSVTSVNGSSYTISFVKGFRIEEHAYYRHAVDILDLPIKPYPYELDMELCEEDLSHLKQYLTENFSAGETVDLWNIWVGVDRSDHLPHFSGALEDFDLETLEQFLKPTQSDVPGQCRLTIHI